VIVSDAVLAAVKAKRATLLLTPARRGELGEQLPPPERGAVVSLQLRAGARGTRVTIAEDATLTTWPLLGHAEAKRAGYASRQAALADWTAQQGAPGDDALVWAVAIVLGDRSAFFKEHSERYLRRKMGGARAYTTDPRFAVHGEGAVPDADLATFAHRATQRREEEEAARLANTLRTIREAIADLDGLALQKDIAKEVNWLRRRAARLEQRAA
jgi:hypothetical protein